MVVDDFGNKEAYTAYMETMKARLTPAARASMLASALEMSSSMAAR